ncbi:MAG: GNAT family N-acetyltransferase [Salinivirgaceae bacterium]
MLEIIKITKEDEFKKTSRDEFVDFMFTHLDRFGDPKKDINKCIDYAFSDNPSEGGFVLAAYYEGKLVGGLIMNNTGMSGYIPENILVYVAVDASYRGKGFGGQIVKESFKQAKGKVKLHVEYDNPAKRLYERLGFISKYAEMRYEND